MSADPPETDAVIALGALTLAFGRVNRLTRHPDGVTPETDPEHTVMLGVIAAALAHRWRHWSNCAAALDVGLICQFALVHDLVEVYAGDTPTLRQLTNSQHADKRARERAARERIREEFGRTLPWLPGMIDVYEAQRLPEARFVRALDKLLPKITHILNNLAVIRAEGMTRTELAARYEAQRAELMTYAADFPELFGLREELISILLPLMPDDYPDEETPTC